MASFSSIDGNASTGWACTRCTFLNDADATSCAMCNTPRNAWICPTCSFASDIYTPKYGWKGICKMCNTRASSILPLISTWGGCPTRYAADLLQQLNQHDSKNGKDICRVIAEYVGTPLHGWKINHGATQVHDVMGHPNTIVQSFSSRDSNQISIADPPMHPTIPNSWSVHLRGQAHKWTMLGICTQTQYQDEIWNQPGTWGWHCGGEVYKDGKRQSVGWPRHIYQDNAIITLTFDPAAGKLSLCASTRPGTTFVLDGIPPPPPSGAYYAFTNLCHASSVEFIETLPQVEIGRQAIEEEKKWRERLVVGAELFARDEVGKFLKATIVEEREGKAPDGARETEFKITFNGFPSIFDKWVPRSSDGLSRTLPDGEPAGCVCM